MPEGSSRDIVLTYMKRALRVESSQFGRLMNTTLRLLAEDDLLDLPRDQDYDGLFSPDFRGNPKLATHLLDCYFQLLVSGVIIPQPPTVPNFPSFDWIILTPFGKEWIEADGEFIPETSSGYLSSLKHSIPELDPVVEQYINEALLTYNRRAFFAAAVMLGAASEKVVYQLMEALQMAVTAKQMKKELANAMERRGLPRMFELIRETLESAVSKKKIPYDVHEGYHHHLISILEAIRVQRNDAVHPTIAEVDQQRVWMSLTAFPAACRKVYDLIEWLKKNKI